MNNSLRSRRKDAILNSVLPCDSDSKRIDILVERIIELENALYELKLSYAELRTYLKNFKCVQVPF